MAEPQGDVGRLSPDKLVVGFSRSRIMKWLLIAVIAHVAFAGATSVGFIRDHWIDPEGAAQRKAALEAKRKAAMEAEEAEPAEPETKAEAKAETDKKAPPDSAKLIEKHKDAPVVKEITEKAKKEDIPKEPDIGISIDETNK
jgi:outer membrane biosynthesis protein TonB